MMNSFLDPTAELAPESRIPLPRRHSLVGLNVGLLDISKPRGNVFIARLDELLTQAGAIPRHYAKPTFTRIAPIELKQQIATECDVVIEALADWGSCTSCSLHDIMDLDRRGIPGGFIASEEFREAAVAQAASLGFDAPRMFVGHPIQDRTDAEMRSLAESTYDQVVALIVESVESKAT